LVRRVTDFISEPILKLLCTTRSSVAYAAVGRSSYGSWCQTHHRARIGLVDTRVLSSSVGSDTIWQAQKGDSMSPAIPCGHYTHGCLLHRLDGQQILETFKDPKFYLFFLLGFFANVPNGGTSNLYAFLQLPCTLMLTSG